MAFPTAEEATSIGKFIKEVGGNSTWDRLAEYLDKHTLSKNSFVINRCFKASIEHLYELWTTPEHIARWLPPVGFEMEYLRADIQPGGTSFFKLSNDAGVTMYGRVEYLKLEKPNLIVYSQQFCDEHENPGRHPLAPTLPSTLLTTIQLVPETEEITRITVKFEPVGQLSKEELNSFLEMRSGMTLGWTGSFDKLEEVLGTSLV
ncbi:MAG: SRPBCC family protein [Planctomycetaceae bacterium]